jgi:hypothetical protein
MAGLAVIARAVQAEIRWWHTEIDGSIIVDEIMPAKALADPVLALTNRGAQRRYPYLHPSPREGGERRDWPVWENQDDRIQCL